jgi:AraC-like DNA-binding protein
VLRSLGSFGTADRGGSSRTSETTYRGVVDHYTERALPVPAALRPWVTGISVATIAGHAGDVTLIDEPDHATTLALRTFPGRRTDLVVMGPRTRALYHLAEPGPSCLKVRLQPGRAQLLLGRPVRGLVDQLVPLADVWGRPDIIDEEPALEWLQYTLLGRLSTRTSSDLSRSDLAHRATSVLSVGAGRRPEQVPVIARRLNISERHLRDLFIDAVGVSPRHFARLDRVRTVLIHARQAHLAQLATEAGYYDQSHMTAEFRRIMGTPPAAFIAGRLPAATSCAG